MSNTLLLIIITVFLLPINPTISFNAKNLFCESCKAFIEQLNQELTTVIYKAYNYVNGFCAELFENGTEIANCEAICYRLINKSQLYLANKINSNVACNVINVC
ncbi:Uncharacterized protein BM_BM13427 [Brugia malayi]|uniref:Bm13427 n=1 Tax=Brugia malayi TaxID=6279 RepID=A0A0K0IXT1_BRUMA|nr:Uncharacterized protein BM_BM13427 [Brugia malayi]CDQ05620.1 Bm13427 [Brugia malayi]VIO95293.1 Uncharacterized protein BM_BM13427 [Brugia malayi]